VEIRNQTSGKVNLRSAIGRFGLSMRVGGSPERFGTMIGLRLQRTVHLTPLSKFSAQSPLPPHEDSAHVGADGCNAKPMALTCAGKCPFSTPPGDLSYTRGTTQEGFCATDTLST